MNKQVGIFPVGLDQFDLDLERLRRCKDISVEKMVRSLKERGQLTPVIVVENQNRFLLVDGFKRYRAVEKLGSAFLSAVLIEADAKQAKAMVYLLNRSGGFSMIQEALLVRELIELDGLTRREASLLMDRHKSWISRRLDMIRRLSPAIIDALMLELIPPGVGPSLARVPPCNQPDFAAVIQLDRLSPNEIRRLTDLYCKAPDPDMKQMILRSPRRALSIVHKEIQTLNRPGKIIFRMIAMVDALMADGKMRHHMVRLKSILNEILEQIQKEES